MTDPGYNVERIPVPVLHPFKTQHFDEAGERELRPDFNTRFNWYVVAAVFHWQDECVSKAQLLGFMRIGNTN